MHLFDPPANPWHSRGYLPHFDQQYLIQAVTFRLVDSLPRIAIDKIERELLELPVELRRQDRLLKLSKWLDQGFGACWLRHNGIAEIVENTMLHFDGERYRLLSWCIMPNHVHVLIEVRHGFSLENIVHSWKSFTANQANKLLQRTGPFWQMEYFDRFIRDAEHFSKSLYYIEENPVKAKLVRHASDWHWSSASSKWRD